jgi:hypothetical protein
MNHLNEEQLVFHYYGEPADRDAAEAHLASCPDCRSNYQSLQRVLNVVEGASIPERQPGYEDELWSRLEPKLGSMRRFNWLIWIQPGKWALAASVVVLVIASFLAGRWMAPTAPPQVASSDPGIREKVLLVALGDHLERSQMVLVELVNTRPGQEIDISDEQKWAEDLLGTNRLYRQTAASTGEESVTAVLEDLERVLVEIARSPSTLSRDELQEIRQRIESQGILFKIRVLGSQMRNPETLMKSETL